MKLELDEIIDGEVKKEKDEVEKRILLMDKPNIWNVYHKGNMEVEMEVEFTKFLFAVGEETNQDVTDISVFDFYTLIQWIEEKHSKNK